VTHRLLDLMNPRGHVTLLGLSNEDIIIPNFAVIWKEISIHCSLATDMPEEFEEMLIFAAEHKTLPIIEEFEMNEEGIKQAIDKLVTGKIRYRGVLRV
jgi:D-arabinose 1-dehydrogenase-like Zn-dependent alcohol dehydrogenase